MALSSEEISEECYFTEKRPKPYLFLSRQKCLIGTALLFLRSPRSCLFSERFIV